MNTCFRLLSVLAIALLTFSPPTASAAGAEKPFTVRIAAQQPGLNYYGYATTLAKLVEQYAPAGSKLEVIPRGGSMSNQTTLDQGKCELAITHVGTAMWAWNGLQEVYGKYGKHENIRFLTPGFMASPMMTLVARRDYVEKTGLDTLEKMLLAKDPPRFIMKPQGSNVIPQFVGLLKCMGKTWEDFQKAGKIIQVPQSQFSEMLKDSRADVYIDTVPHNHAGMTEILMTNDLVWVPYSDKILQYMADVFSLPTGLIRPESQGGYKGIPEEGFRAPADSHTLLIHKDVPNEVAYSMAKILAEHSNVMIEENGVLQGWDPNTMHETLSLPMPVHPGAAQYYKERGWMK